MLTKRKFIISLLLLMIVFSGICFLDKLRKPEIHSESAILMDASTGDVLYEKNATTSYPVASMSKLMSEYIVLDRINDGFIYWDDQVVMSETANSLEEAAVTIPVGAGDSLTVRELFTAMVVSSANNATIALAEYIAGSEEAFTVLMNEKAIEMGLSNETIFFNATGLPSSQGDQTENRMSAKDVATLASYLLKNHQDVAIEAANMKYYHIPSHNIDLVNTNKMLHHQDGRMHFDGMDGLKTGFTDAAGYCFTGTASKNGRRLISVIVNAKDDEMRFIETKKLLSYGFSKLDHLTLKSTLIDLFK